ncbi:siderophore-interacting protein [Actinoplanes oblitus]|uniref:Siderophore-interacting protein n=1 Tax=Actinoplanes oblitus TaxID=3040509 RepID=A0ABY8WQK7_9ACTN|nr:siderophore-interacting protein [Actinoplanes oblitus]WIN00182.1 siderophore-interacting protein [Actinoplanes oblitus]
MIVVSARARPVVRLALLRLTRIAPRVTRMVAGGADIARLDPGPFTDSHIRIVFPRPGIAYPADLDLRHIHATLPRSAWPRTRTYTIRAFDAAAGELTIDFYHHGRPGLTPTWLAGLKPGDPVLLREPRGLYRPRPVAGWHLLAGDAVALPAIAVTLEAMTAGMRARVIVEVVDEYDEQPLPTAADADIRWIHTARGDSLATAVRSLAFEPGVVQAFVHGEGAVIRGLRRHLLDERGVARDLLSISGYWRRGLTDEQWREWKARQAGRCPDRD